MFGRDEVNDVMKALQKNIGFFASEAHFQMSFAAEILKKYKDKFAIVPEYPTTRKITTKYYENETTISKIDEKTDEIDLVVVDMEDKDENGNNKKTYIEFKHKTTNTSSESLVVPVKNLPGVSIIPTSMAAQDLGRFDCWSDIERLEYYKKHGANLAFFILVTNDETFWNDKGEHGFGINEPTYNPEDKKWSYWDPTLDKEIKKGKKVLGKTKGSVPDNKKDSVGANRNRVIEIKEKHVFDWGDFIVAKHNKNPREKFCGKYERLIVEI